MISHTPWKRTHLVILWQMQFSLKVRSYSIILKILWEFVSFSKKFGISLWGKSKFFPQVYKKTNFKSYFQRYYFLAIYFKVKNFVFLYFKKLVARMPLEYSVNILFKSVKRSFYKMCRKMYVINKRLFYIILHKRLISGNENLEI